MSAKRKIARTQIKKKVGSEGLSKAWRKFQIDVLGGLSEYRTMRLKNTKPSERRDKHWGSF